jgi:hypothetical protein
MKARGIYVARFNVYHALTLSVPFPYAHSGQEIENVELPFGSDNFLPSSPNAPIWRLGIQSKPV